ncbi:hypothetical protein MVEN_00023100 [Mycena venus]|uniref:Uncharacterized protein n=1 Tax=Mycena venus TaxID=2733690 RepID=A0A8H6Z300_9AGAR|nr:hypothetical protein MVEN_00023100 [Mycena venus]
MGRQHPVLPPSRRCKRRAHSRVWAMRFHLSTLQWTTAVHGLRTREEWPTRVDEAEATSCMAIMQVDRNGSTPYTRMCALRAKVRMHADPLLLAGAALRTTQLCSGAPYRLVA